MKTITIDGLGDGGLPLLMRADEVAALLRTTRAAIYSRVQRGQIPYIRDGRRILFSRDALLQLIVHSQRGR